MPALDMPYIDDHVEAQVERLAAGEEAGYWRALHWGYYEDPEHAGDDAEGYAAAAEALTERIVSAGEVADRTRILDVGCGFGGTIDHVAARNQGCTLMGLNIDERQLRHARVLLAAEGRAAGPDTPFIIADGCRLPVADASFDHVLAVECIFHFPSRKAFLREAARVLRPGGTLALSDFIFAPGAFASVAATIGELQIGNFYGHNKKPLTSAGFARAARSAGFDVLVDEDITANTLPTYAALRRSYTELGQTDAVDTLTGVEALARAGGWEYHVLAFRRR